MISLHYDTPVSDDDFEAFCCAVLMFNRFYRTRINATRDSSSVNIESPELEEELAFAVWYGRCGWSEFTDDMIALAAIEYHITKRCVPEDVPENVPGGERV